MDTKDAGKMGGASKSPAKQAASRRNGAKGGRPRNPTKARLDYLRAELRAGRISYGEIAELMGYKGHLIRIGDIELAEAAGIPEREFTSRNSK